jgi:hypothetical protein
MNWHKWFKGADHAPQIDEHTERTEAVAARLQRHRAAKGFGRMFDEALRAPKHKGRML